MEKAGWMIRLDFDSVKGMFDPVINRVIKIIGDQLNDSSEKCSAMFLVGGFSESPYLLRKVREAFIDRVTNISVPALPIAAVVRGAIKYGLNVEIIKERVLKWTYGIEICRDWVRMIDSNFNSLFFFKMNFIEFIYIKLGCGSR